MTYDLKLSYVTQTNPSRLALFFPLDRAHGTIDSDATLMGRKMLQKLIHFHLHFFLTPSEASCVGLEMGASFNAFN